MATSILPCDPLGDPTTPFSPSPDILRNVVWLLQIWFPTPVVILPVKIGSRIHRRLHPATPCWAPTAPDAVSVRENPNWSEGLEQITSTGSYRCLCLLPFFRLPENRRLFVGSRFVDRLPTLRRADKVLLQGKPGQASLFREPSMIGTSFPGVSMSAPLRTLGGSFRMTVLPVYYPGPPTDPFNTIITSRGWRPGRIQRRQSTWRPVHLTAGLESFQ